MLSLVPPPRNDRAARSGVRSLLGSPVLSAVLLLAGMAAQPVQAQTTLFSDFGTGNSYSSAYYGEGSTTIRAFQFTPTVSGLVGSMSAALEFGNGSTAVTIEILNNAGSLPGSTVLFSASGNAPFNPGGVVTFSSNGSFLTAGTLYWAAIVGPSSGGDNWFVNSTGATGLEATSENTGATYTSNGIQTLPAFSVSSAATSAAAAPEPTALLLLAAGISGASGLVGTIAARRRRKAE